MSMVASACHPMDGMAGWNVQIPPQAVGAILPPPRSYYVVSWVPRALPEVVQLIKELPSDSDRCRINKHFELGMLVMRRCGVQNPEEIKCLLDGFREGTTRLSAKESIKSPSEDSSAVGRSQREGTYSASGFCSSPIERRKLLIFFNDHRASRPWVLCPAKHCIKSARTTGKVKGRVKIFQYDQRSSSVKIPKLFTDCLSNFLTRDQYVFATFCPQQKYTDHELDWFALQSRRQAGFPTETGGDVIFRELLEEHDTKGTRVWPFDDYIIFSNSQAKIVAVFKKKQPLVTMYRQNWPGGSEECNNLTTTASSLTLGPFVGGMSGMCQQTNPHYIAATDSSEDGDGTSVFPMRSSISVQLCGATDGYVFHDSNGKQEADGDDAATEISVPGKEESLVNPSVLTSATSTTTSIGYADDEPGNDSIMQSGGGNYLKNNLHKRSTPRYGRRRTSSRTDGADDNDSQQDDSDEYCDLPDEDHGMSDSDFLTSSSVQNRISTRSRKYKGRRSHSDPAAHRSQQLPNPFGGMIDCQPAQSVCMGNVISPAEMIGQAEEAEHLLVKIMTRVLARLEPLDDPNSLDLGTYTSSVSAVSIDRQSSTSGGGTKTEAQSAINHPQYAIEENRGTEGMYRGFPHAVSLGGGSGGEQEETNIEGRNATTSGAASSSSDGPDAGQSGFGADGRENGMRKMEIGLELENKRRKVISYPSPNNAVLYHDLVRQFLSRLAFGLDHPPLPQKRIPDTVKRVVTKIVSDSIREVNLALLTSSIRCQTEISEDGGGMDAAGNSSAFQQYCAPHMGNGHMMLASNPAIYMPFEGQSSNGEGHRTTSSTGHSTGFMQHFGFGDGVPPGSVGSMGMGSMFPGSPETAHAFSSVFDTIGAVDAGTAAALAALGANIGPPSSHPPHYLSHYIGHTGQDGVTHHGQFFIGGLPGTPNEGSGETQQHAHRSMVMNGRHETGALMSSEAHRSLPSASWCSNTRPLFGSRDDGYEHQSTLQKQRAEAGETSPPPSPPSLYDGYQTQAVAVKTVEEVGNVPSIVLSRAVTIEEQNCEEAPVVDSIDTTAVGNDVAVDKSVEVIMHSGVVTNQAKEQHHGRVRRTRSSTMSQIEIKDDCEAPERPTRRKRS